MPLRNFPRAKARLLGAFALLGALASRANANIYQWEWIDPANHALGKRMSSTLAPDGAGVSAVPGAPLYRRNLTQAYFIGANLSLTSLGSSTLNLADFSNATLTNASFYESSLVGATFVGANLGNATLSYAKLDGADFTNANLTNARLDYTTVNGATFLGATIRGVWFVNSGLTPQQLYSTASYQAHDLRGVAIAEPDLSGWDFSNQDMTGADTGAANLAGVNFTGATIVNMKMSIVTGLTFAQIASTASYRAHDLHGVYLNLQDMQGWDLSNCNLADAHVPGANLEGANLAGADISRTDFENSNLSAQQLYSTHSYQNHDLRGAYLSLDDLSDWDFSNQNLTGTRFLGSTLTGANLSGATIAGADFHYIMTIQGPGLSFAQLHSTASYQNHDLHGIDLECNNMNGWDFTDQNLTGATVGTANTPMLATDFRGSTLDSNQSKFKVYDRAILPGGQVRKLSALSGETFILRDYTNPAITGVRVTDSMSIAAKGVLSIVFSDADWGSTISFAPGIAVSRGGTLMLGLADLASAEALVGSSWQVFDWGGISASGQFSVVSADPSLTWDTSQLYTTGIVTLASTAPNVVPEPATTGAILLLLVCGRRNRNRRCFGGAHG